MTRAVPAIVRARRTASGALAATLAVAAFAVAPAAHAADGNGAGWMSPWLEGPPASGFVPSVWADRHGVGFTLSGAFAFGLDERGPSGRAPVADLEGPLLEFGARGGGRTFGGDARGVGAMSVRIHLAARDRGVWLASSGIESGDAERSLIPLLASGAWARRGPLTFSTQLIQLLRPLRTEGAPVSETADSMGTGVIDRENGVAPRTDDLRLLTGAETTVGWTMRRFELQTRLGVAVSAHHRPARWGELRASWWARPSLAVYALTRSADRVPAAFESVRGSYAAIGVQLVPGRQTEVEADWDAFAPEDAGASVERESGASYRITVRVEGHRVEFASDATDWQSVPAESLGDGRWQVTLVLVPGVHRVAMRVDGGDWRAVPGLPTTRDEWGEAGVIVAD